MSRPRHLLRAAQSLLPPPGDGGVSVLCYHLVEGGTSSPVDLPMDVFRAQMEELASSSELEVVSLEAAVEALRTGAAASGRLRVVLTFDDAYANFAEEAWPVLAELKLASTLCVPVGFLDATSPSPITGTDLPPISWDALAALTATGLLTITAHSWTHPDLRTLPGEAFERELGEARKRLEERLGVDVNSFCYPRARWSRAAEQRVKEHYDVALVGGGRRLRPRGFDPLRMTRVSMRSDMPVGLLPILRSRVWIEEWLADRLRQWR